MHRQAIGKRNEFKLWSWLLDESFDVYPTMVDDKGIDGIVGWQGKYFEIQLKSGENWNNQRGIDVNYLSANPDRVWIILNYTEEKIRFFTAKQILDEPEWQESIRWQNPQIKLPAAMLEKYKDQDWDGLLRYLRKNQA